uniref:Uncharacterized protein n=1 Tax=Escherichia coli TaxID=562 RepID=A0A1W5T873_ECOLX|nr:hypothetical protein [Escherichia coli]
MATSRYFQAAHDVIVKTLDQSLTGQLDNFSSIASQLGKYGISIYIVVCLYHNSWEAKNRSAGFLWNLCRFWLILVFVKNMGGG